MLTNSNSIFKCMLLNTLEIKRNVLFKTCFIYKDTEKSHEKIYDLIKHYMMTIFTTATKIREFAV